MASTTKKAKHAHQGQQCQCLGHHRPSSGHPGSSWQPRSFRRRLRASLPGSRGSWRRFPGFRELENLALAWAPCNLVIFCVFAFVFLSIMNALLFYLIIFALLANILLCFEWYTYSSYIVIQNLLTFSKCTRLSVAVRPVMVKSKFCWYRVNVFFNKF